MKRIRSAILACTVLCLTLLSSCSNSIEHKDITSQINPDNSQEQVSSVDSNSGNDIDSSGSGSSGSDIAHEPTYSVHLVCAGDNLIHNYIYDEAAQRAGGDGYDFSFVYERALRFFDDADIAILNQETIVTDEFEPSTYPNFCSPGALGDYMVDVVGFNVISMANNHVLDKGEDGLIATLDYWDTQHPDVIRYGAYRSTDDMNNIRTMEVNGITFAFLGYMEHTNGIQHTGAKGTELVYLNELDTIEAQIKKADEIADVVVVSPHFGVEVISDVTDDQRYLTQKFVEWGADLIIGTQPHTIQECGWVEKPDGGNAFVYYCLGNFVSAMSNNLAWIGGIGDLYIEMDPDTHEITIKDPKIIPIISHYGDEYSGTTIYPYSEYSEELASQHGYDVFTMEFIDEAISHVPEEFLSIE